MWNGRKIHIHPDYRHLHGLIEKVPEGMLPVVHTFCHKRNTVQRIKLADVEVVVKRFKRPNLINSFVYNHLRPSKAYRSYANALRFIELDIPTPFPIAVIHDTRWGRLTDSWYISLFDSALPLADIITEADRPTMNRKFETLPMMPQFVDFATSLFQKGVWQRDFNRGNFLYREISPGEWIFPMVDINRVKYGPVTPKMVATSWMRFGADTCPGLVEKLTVDVGCRLGFNENECRLQARKSVTRGARIERRRQLKRALRRRFRKP